MPNGLWSVLLLSAILFRLCPSVEEKGYKGKAVNSNFKGLLMENVRNEMEPRESVFGD